MADGTLKVGTITTSSGSGTITLGQSGETLSVPSGATLDMSSGTMTLNSDMKNTPAFQAAMSTASQALSDNTQAKVAFNVATYDSGSTYDTSLYRWTPGVAGKYFVSTSVYNSADSDSEMSSTHCTFKKSGTIIHYIGNLDSRTAGYGRGKVTAGSAVIELGAADYVEVFATVNTVSGGAARVNGETTQTWFNGFKLVGF
tara:strand:+ start:851 stop:1450 length:600 start_codon:yes stop_codon:yes gene_type:complete